MSDENDPTPPPADDETPATSGPTPSESQESPPPMEEFVQSAPDGLPVPGQGSLSEKDDKTFGMLAHLLGIFTGFVGPLIIWLVKKDESPFVDDQGKEALNFQIWMTIGVIVSYFLTFVLIGCITLPAIIVMVLVFGIIGTMKANEGIAYRYPVNIRIIT